MTLKFAFVEKVELWRKAFKKNVFKSWWADFEKKLFLFGWNCFLGATLCPKKVFCIIRFEMISSAKSYDGDNLEKKILHSTKSLVAVWINLFQ